MRLFTPAASDLPMNAGDTGTRFVILVVAMMTALATLALGGALVIGALRATWVDAVRGNLTVEIPASDGKGAVRDADTLAREAAALSAALQKTKGVTAVHALTRRDVENLVKPWLGNGAESADLPLPALLGVNVTDPDDRAVRDAVVKVATTTDAAATVETHQSWIADLRRFSLMLLLGAGAMAFFTVACSILTVAGAVQARLSAHKSDIDLLHVMGATDTYIGAQFVRVVVRAVGGAALAGTATGIVLLKIGGLAASEIKSAVIPVYAWHLADMLAFLALPALVTGLCFIAARITVLRSLRVMP